MKMTTRMLLLGVISACLSIVGVARSQTIITGPTISGGTWSPSGNPYIVTGNCTINSGQTLTISPGVVVWIGSGVSINNNGLIKAVGTTSQRIEFQSPVSSVYWGSRRRNFFSVKCFSI